MVPDLELQLDVVIKALGDVVARALPPQEKVAAEQLGLSIATLRLVRSRIGLEARRSRSELTSAVALAEGVAMLDSSPELAAALELARAVLADPDPLPGSQGRAVRRLSDATCAIVDASVGEVGEAIDLLVVERSKPTTDLARAWGLAAGFEPAPAEVPSLGVLLGLDGAG